MMQTAGKENLPLMQRIPTSVTLWGASAAFGVTLAAYEVILLSAGLNLRPVCANDFR